MNTSSNSRFEEITSWLELDEAIGDIDSRAAATYAYGAAQQLGIEILLSEEDGELMLRSGEILSTTFDFDCDSEIRGLGKALEFFSKLQQANQPTFEAQIQTLREEVNRLRATFQSSIVSQGDLRAMDGESWADFVRTLHDEAKAAGGSIETFGHHTVCYFRCARLKHCSIMSPVLLKPPYHSGQNHRIRFALPQDVELMRKCFKHDVELYRALQNVEPEAASSAESDPNS